MSQTPDGESLRNSPDNPFAGMDGEEMSLNTAAGIAKDMLDSYVQAEFSQGQAAYLVACCMTNNPLVPPAM